MPSQGMQEQRLAARDRAAAQMHLVPVSVLLESCMQCFALGAGMSSVADMCICIACQNHQKVNRKHRRVSHLKQMSDCQYWETPRRSVDHLRIGPD